jgi:hypothetical protein
VADRSLPTAGRGRSAETATVWPRNQQTTAAPYPVPDVETGEAAADPGPALVVPDLDTRVKGAIAGPMADPETATTRGITAPMAMGSGTKAVKERAPGC